jgi:transcription elongation GreA/GreB family factor
MNKSHLHTLIIEKLLVDLSIAKDALKASHEAATHAESKAENKYDTRGLEAAYLADGQRRRAHEIETALSSYRNLPVRSHINEAITLGALVSLESPGVRRWVFLGPDAAGLNVTVAGHEVLVITPHSPLGRALLNCHEGEEAEIQVNGRTQRFAVRTVC